MPFSVNRPILTDEERHEVGVRYKQAGQEAATQLGYALTDADMPNRVAAWRAVCGAGPTAVTCWRGGLRSKLAAEFIGGEVPRVAGGYKALRGYVMGELETGLQRVQTLVVGGLTGAGKTRLLREVGGSPHLFALDLEAAAKHRGSAFGETPEPQPAQATFENSVATTLLLNDKPVLVLEDESRTIGARQLPDAVYGAIQTAPLVIVEESLDSRVRRIHQDYVLSLSGALGIEATRAYLGASLMRLKKRLSGPTVETALQSLRHAHEAGLWEESGAHRPWIEPLLLDYYDPLYHKSLAKAARPVVFRGTLEECTAWLTHRPV